MRTTAGEKCTPAPSWRAYCTSPERMRKLICVIAALLMSSVYTMGPRPQGVFAWALSFFLRGAKMRGNCWSGESISRGSKGSRGVNRMALFLWTELAQLCASGAGMFSKPLPHPSHPAPHADGAPTSPQPIPSSHLLASLTPTPSPLSPSVSSSQRVHAKASLSLSTRPAPHPGPYQPAIFSLAGPSAIMTQDQLPLRNVFMGPNVHIPVPALQALSGRSHFFLSLVFKGVQER